MASRTSKSASWTFESPADLQRWGAAFAKRLRPGDVIALVGPLGAGKTTLVQGVAAALGYRRGANSPTFALANEYRTKKVTMYHMDMYRLTPAELRAFPLEDYWDSGISVIEWADRVADRLPAETLTLRLRAPKTSVRTLTLVSPTPAWQSRLAPLLAS